MRYKIQVLLIVVFVMVMTTIAFAQTTYTSTGSGTWSAMTWSPAGTPGSSDAVIIADGHTVTIDQPVSVASLTVGQGVSGVLTFDGVSARAVTVTGNITVNAGAQFITQASGTFTNTLAIGGDLTNNGTFDMSQGGTTLLCNVTFNKAGSQSISGTGTTTRFNVVALSKADTTSANKVNASINVTTNGTFLATGSFGQWAQSAGTLTLAPSTTVLAIAAANQLEINGSANLSASCDLTFSGSLTINTSGTVNIGISGNNRFLQLAQATTGRFILASGTINVFGKMYMPTTSPKTYLTGANINVDPSANISGDYGFRVLNAGSANFTFNAGTLTILNPASTAGTTGEFNVAAGFNMSGTAKVVIGQGASTGTASQIRVGGAGLVNMGNLEIKTGNGVAVVVGTTTINGNLTLTSGTFKDSISTITVKGNISNSGMHISGSFPGVGWGRISLESGSVIHTLSGNGTYGKLTLNDIYGAQLTGSPVIADTFKLTTGNLALNGNTLTLGTSIGFPGTLAYTAGYLTGIGTFTRWFATAAISGNAGLFPMGVGSNNRSLAIGGSPSTGGSISVSYNDASAVSTPFGAGYPENLQTFVYRYDANWVVVPGGGYTDGAMTLTIHGDGIPGITSVSDLNISAATTIATGVWAAPSGTTSAPVLTRNGLTQGTIVTNPFYIASTSTSLPVEMTSFTASKQGASNAILRWSTATEVNNNGFEVERRVENSTTWTKVGFVSGAGTSTTPREYSYQDVNLAPGVYVYRLKQIDNSGTYKYSASTQVDVGVAKRLELLSNYPNPFNPATEIRFSVPEDGFATLKVFNMLGQEVATLFSGIAQSGHYIPATFNAGKLSSGVYFSRLDFNGKSLVQRMLMAK